jgi:hypothetical protein
LKRALVVAGAALLWLLLAVVARRMAPFPVPCDCGPGPWGMVVALACVSGRALPPRGAALLASAAVVGVVVDLEAAGGVMWQPVGWIRGVRFLGPVLALCASATVLRRRFVLACVSASCVLVVTHAWEPYLEVPLLGRIVQADPLLRYSLTDVAFTRLVSRNDLPALLALLPATSGSYRSQLQATLVARLGQAAAPILREELLRADPEAKTTAKALLSGLESAGQPGRSRR